MILICRQEKPSVSATFTFYDPVLILGMKLESGTVSDFSLTRLKGSYNVYEPRTMDDCTGDNLILGFRDKGIYGLKVSLLAE